MKRTRDEVLKTLQDKKEAIARFGVKKLGLFGSVVTGEATEASDLDFVWNWLAKPLMTTWV